MRALDVGVSRAEPVMSSYIFVLSSMPTKATCNHKNVSDVVCLSSHLGKDEQLSFA